MLQHQVIVFAAIWKGLYSEIESRLGFISFSCASSSATISKDRFRSQDLVRVSSARVA